MAVFGAAIFLVLTQVLTTICENQQKFPVQVYYETRCRYSVKFFTKQLCPVWDQISDVVDVQLFPYGNAVKQVDTTGQVSIKCQHGEKECLGNMMHACAVNLYPYSQARKFVCCSMSLKSSIAAGEQCAVQLGLTFDPIQRCMDSNAGFSYMSAYGNATDQLNPKHTFVPWILFNGVHDPEDMNAAQANFSAVLCKSLGANALTASFCSS